MHIKNGGAVRVSTSATKRDRCRRGLVPGKLLPMANTLTPADELAKENPVRIEGESQEYREARTALLAAEIELRRHIESVAAQRRALPPGPQITSHYQFLGEDGQHRTLASLFGDRNTLIIYTAMYGPKMKRSCPMCTNAVGPWNAIVPDVEQLATFVVVSRGEIEKLKSWKQERDWHNVRLYQDLGGEYSKDFFGVDADDNDNPALTVFTKKDSNVYLFWTAEMSGSTADPGQDPRGAPDASPLWSLLDLTPTGRPPKWYPKLNY